MAAEPISGPMMPMVLRWKPPSGGKDGQNIRATPAPPRRWRCGLRLKVPLMPDAVVVGRESTPASSTPLRGRSAPRPKIAAPPLRRPDRPSAGNGEILLRLADSYHLQCRRHQIDLPPQERPDLPRRRAPDRGRRRVRVQPRRRSGERVHRQHARLRPPGHRLRRSPRRQRPRRHHRPGAPQPGRPGAVGRGLRALSRLVRRHGP